jgi:DNA-binding NarL/FixJ family response regulator
MLRVALIDDSLAHCAALGELLLQQPGLDLVGAGSLHSDIVAGLVEQAPDVVLLDPPPLPEAIREVTGAIHAALPHARLIVTSLEHDHDCIRHIWAASGEAFVPSGRLFREPTKTLEALPTC